MPDDTSKPTDTIPAAAPQVIPSGGARAALVQATANLASALEAYTSTAEAIARALDVHDGERKAMRQALDAT